MWWCAFIANASGLILACEAAFWTGDSTPEGDEVMHGERGMEVRTNGNFDDSTV